MPISLNEHTYVHILYSSLFTISGRQLKHTEMNRETEIRQTKYTKLLQKTYLCTYATYTYISLHIQVRVIIILHYLSYIYNKYLPNMQLFFNFSSKLSVRLANITLGKLKPK